MSYLLHTPIIYRLVREPISQDPALFAAVRDISAGSNLYISAVSHGNILGEIIRIPDPGLRGNANTNYRQLIASIGARNVLAFDVEVSHAWGEIRAVVRPELGVSAEALMIAATAQFYSFSLVCYEEAWHQLLPDLKRIYV